MVDTDALCRDKHGNAIREGDMVRAKTAASLNGVFPVVRGEDGHLYFVVDYPDAREPVKHLVYGFYPGTLEVVSRLTGV